MIDLKTPEEIEYMRKAGSVIKKVLPKLIEMSKPGVKTREIDDAARQMIEAEGVETSFTKVPGYSWTTCLPINEQIVHTPPTERELIDGDVFTIDIGAYFKGFHVDHATTILIGEGDEATKDFLRIGEETLEKSIAQIRIGDHIGKISQIIEKAIYGNGYFILRDLTGHGVGRELHEAPYVPGILDVPVEKTPIIEKGLAIAVEVIYSMGSESIINEPGDSWSIITADGSISACFERTIAFVEKKPFLLT